MRTGLIVFGVIFLVLGGFFYFIPSQTAKATTTTVGDTTDVRTSYATVSIPLPLTYAVLLVGFILAVLGFALPGPRTIIKESSVKDSSASTTETEDDVVETKESNDIDGVTHKVVHERHVQHTHAK